MTNVVLGAFTFDTEHKLLYRNGIELAAEPKVMDLLLYLYNCRDRYVSLQELHEKVWVDRVVSDAAVRGTVKKLRILFEDNSNTEPQYIKSVSKRGYKLICSVEAQLASPLQSQPSASLQEDILNASGGYAVTRQPESIDPIPSDAYPKKSRLGFYKYSAVVIVLVALLFLSLNGRLVNLSEPELSSAELNNMVLVMDFPGDKRSLTMSSDGRYVAFTGRTSPDQDSQVYLYDRTTGRSRQLTQQATNAYSVSFTKNDKAVVYSNSVAGSSSLHLLPLTVAEPEKLAVTLLENKHYIGAITSEQKGSTLLLVMAESAQDQFMLYNMNSDTSEISRVATVSDTHSGIYYGQFSPDQSKFMYLKRRLNTFQLIVRNMQTNDEAVIYETDLFLSTVIWKNNSQLIMLDDKSIRQIDLDGLQLTVLLDNPERQISDIVMRDEQLFLLKKEKVRSERLFIEQSASVKSAPDLFLEPPADVIAMFYSEDPSLKWIVRLSEGVHSIALFSTTDKTVNQVFSSSKFIELYDVYGETLLFREGERLVVLDLEKKHLRYISSPSEIFSDAVFSQDGRSVLFGSQISADWEIQQYDLQSSQISTYLKRFRSIRLYKEGAFLADADGSLFYRANADGQILNLEQQICIDLICRWYLSKDEVIWSSYDSRFTYLHQLKIANMDYSVHKSRFLSFFPRFAFNPLSNKLMYLSANLNDIHLYSLDVTKL